MVFTESALGFLDLSLFVLVFATVHDFLGLQLIDLLLSELALDLSLLSTLVSMCLVNLDSAGLVTSLDGILRLVLGYSAISGVVHAAEHLVLSHAFLFTSGNLRLKNLLEVVDVVGKELRHLWHSECLHVSASSHGFDSELLEVKDVEELFLNLIQLNCVLFNLPLFFSLGLLNLGFRSLDQHIEEIRVDVEVLLGHLDDVFDFLVLIDDLREAITERSNLSTYLSFLLLSDLKLTVLFGTELGLLDGVDRLIHDVLGLLGDSKSLTEVASIEAINMRVNLGQVGWVIGVEGHGLIVADLLDLIVRHEVSSFNTF